MIKERPYREHRRNHSELHATTTICTQKQKKKEKGKGANHLKKNNQSQVFGKDLNSDVIHSLVSKSMRKVPKKQIIVEDLQQLPEERQGTQQAFFRFGKKSTAKGFSTNRPNMQEIVQVPDTGSYSQRNTQGRPDNKENRDYSNRQRQDTLRHMRLSLEKLQQVKTKEGHSHRVMNNVSKHSKRSITRSSRSHNCSQSTVELKTKTGKTRPKSRPKSKIKIQAWQKQVKMIWQCVGQMWVKNKATEKIVEENSYCIEQLIRKTQLYEKDLLQLKLVHSERPKPAYNRYQ